MLIKKVTYFGEFGYLNSSCIRKSIILLFLSSSRDKFTCLQQNSVTDVFVDFPPPCWCPCDLNLGKSLCILTFFLFPDSGLYLLNGFYFYLDMAWHWKPAIIIFISLHLNTWLPLSLKLTLSFQNCYQKFSRRTACLGPSHGARKERMLLA